MRDWKSLALAAGLAAPALAQAAAGWIADTATGCRVWNPEPKPNESISWNGPCPDGVASGPGLLQWFQDGKLSEQFEGSLRNGRADGPGAWIFADGGRYEGEYKDGNPDGRGVGVNADGSRYDGEFRNGNYEGRGTLIYADGGRYEGDFKNDEPDGHGVEVNPNGSRYEGGFKAGKLDGRGVLTVFTGTRYDGDFKDGQFEGQGTMTLPNGSTYKGEFRAGRPDGWVTVTDANGVPWSGLWHAGCYTDGKVQRVWGTTPQACGYTLPDIPDGSQRVAFPDGGRYDGEIRRSMFSGRGTYVGPEGDRYEGRFFDDRLLDGKATTISRDGVKLVADLKYGHVIHAIRTFADGRRYEGPLVGDKENGHGVEKLPNGDVFEGEYKVGKPDGPGVLRLASGKTYAGDWKAGCLVTPTEVRSHRTPLATCGVADIKDGQGTLLLPNGILYEGHFADGTFQGKGKMTAPDGSYFEGPYRAGQLNGLGVMVDVLGNRYEGDIRDGKPDGRGTLKTVSGASFSGIWKEGCLVGHSANVTFMTSRKTCTFK